MSVAKLNFTQSSISAHFGNGVAVIPYDRQSDTHNAPITVVRFANGETASLDNRRLASCKLSGIDNIFAHLKPASHNVNAQTGGRFTLLVLVKVTYENTDFYLMTETRPRTWGACVYCRGAAQGRKFPLAGRTSPPTIRPTERSSLTTSGSNIPLVPGVEVESFFSLDRSCFQFLQIALQRRSDKSIHLSFSSYGNTGWDKHRGMSEYLSKEFAKDVPDMEVISMWGHRSGTPITASGFVEKIDTAFEGGRGCRLI